MPNLFGGNKYKKGKKGGRKNKNPTAVFDVTNGVHYYGQVIQKLGHNRLSIKLQTGETIQGVIPGKFLKKLWFNKEDFVVVEHVGGEFYDVIQKIQAQDQLETASKNIGIKLNKDDYNIYRIDEDDEDEDDENNELINPNENHIVTKSIYRQREKERDNIRRKNRDENDFDRPIAVADKSAGSESGSGSGSGSDSESESESESESLDAFGNKSSKD
jgi:translation initiation factor IF-1